MGEFSWILGRLSNSTSSPHITQLKHCNTAVTAQKHIERFGEHRGVNMLDKLSFLCCLHVGTWHRSHASYSYVLHLQQTPSMAFRDVALNLYRLKCMTSDRLKSKRGGAMAHVVAWEAAPQQLLLEWLLWGPGKARQSAARRPPRRARSGEGPGIPCASGSAALAGPSAEGHSLESAAAWVARVHPPLLHRHCTAHNTCWTMTRAVSSGLV